MLASSLRLKARPLSAEQRRSRMGVRGFLFARPIDPYAPRMKVVARNVGS
jgi:hypothetical protein